MNRHYRTAEIIAAVLEDAAFVVMDIVTPEQDSHVCRVLTYLNHYFGKFWIEDPGNGKVLIWKQQM